MADRLAVALSRPGGGDGDLEELTEGIAPARPAETERSRERHEQRNETLLWGPRVQLKTSGGANQSLAGVTVTAGGAVIASGMTSSIREPDIPVIKRVPR